MADPVAVFQEYFQTTVVDIAAVETAIAGRLFNTFAADKAALPYAVHQVVPLNDVVGQSHMTSMTRLICDLKFITSSPPPENVHAAINAVDEYFRTSESAEFGGMRITVRRDRPIYIPDRGVTAGEKLLNIGSSYLVWIHGLST